MRARPRGLMRTPRLMGAVYRRILTRMEQVGWVAPRRRVRIGKASLLLIVLTLRAHRMKPAKVYIVGGAGFPVFPPRSPLPREGFPWKRSKPRARRAGAAVPISSPRSIASSTTAITLMLSGNRAVRDYLRVIGSEGNFVGPATTDIAFADVKRANAGRSGRTTAPLPWWIFSKMRRVPGTRAFDYLRLGKLSNSFRQGHRQRRAGGAAHPSVPARGAQHRTRAGVGGAHRGSLARDAGQGRAARTGRASLIPSLAAAFIDPAIAFLESRGGVFRFGQRLRSFVLERDRGDGPRIAADECSLVAENDSVILAAPPWVAK